MKNLPIILFTLLLSGCLPTDLNNSYYLAERVNPFIVPNYTVRINNVNLLKNGHNAISVLQETPGFDDSGKKSCRGRGTVQAPVGQTFSSYIIGALKDELTSTNLLDENAANTLYVKVMRVDFSAEQRATRWIIYVEYSIKGDTFSISNVHRSRSSFDGDKACRLISVYFEEAVGVHLRQLYTKPEFRAAIGLYD